MKDERNKRFSVLFAAYRFPCFFFFFPLFFFTNISHASFLSRKPGREIWPGKKIKTIFCAASRTVRRELGASLKTERKLRLEVELDLSWKVKPVAKSTKIAESDNFLVSVTLLNPRLFVEPEYPVRDTHVGSCDRSKHKIGQLSPSLLSNQREKHVSLSNFIFKKVILLCKHTCNNKM